MNTLSDLFGDAQRALFEGLMQPLLFGLGLGNLLEDGFVAPAGCSWGCCRSPSC